MCIIVLSFINIFVIAFSIPCMNPLILLYFLFFIFSFLVFLHYIKDIFEPHTNNTKTFQQTNSSYLYSSINPSSFISFIFFLPFLSLEFSDDHFSYFSIGKHIFPTKKQIFSFAMPIVIPYNQYVHVEII